MRRTHARAISIPNYDCLNWEMVGCRGGYTKWFRNFKSSFVCLFVLYLKWSIIAAIKRYRDHSGCGPSQWKTTLQRKAVFHCLSPYPEWSLWLFCLQFSLNYVQVNRLSVTWNSEPNILILVVGWIRQARYKKSKTSKKQDIKLQWNIYMRFYGD